MKILLINNNTLHFPYLMAALEGNDVEVRNYRPGLNFDCSDKDLVILSGGGGEGLEIHDEHKPGHLWYEDQMSFVKNSTKPIIGICMGFEVISRAFGARVDKMTKGVNNFMYLKTTPAGKKMLGLSKIKQFEAHDWQVLKAPKDFKVLAESQNGIEIIKHRTKPIIATQFHPEKGGTLQLSQLVAALQVR